MRQECLLTNPPEDNGCLTYKDSRLMCDARPSHSRRCTKCEGYITLSSIRKTRSQVTTESVMEFRQKFLLSKKETIPAARKPRPDVTPESVIEFRQKFLPSRERPSKALIVGATSPMGIRKPVYGFTDADNGIARDFAWAMAALSRRMNENKRKQQQERKKRDTALIRLYEPVKESFDHSRPDRCPAVMSNLVIDLYRVLSLMMSESSIQGQIFQGTAGTVEEL